MSPIDAATFDRFWSKVDASGDCWVWTSATDGTRGYGRFWFGRKQVHAHRFAYELLVGPIPDGLTIDHRCRVILCVNPAHLQPETMRDNVMRGYGVAAMNARKAQCANGHLLGDHNLRAYVRPNGKWRRDCRACLRARKARWVASKAAVA